MNTIYCKTYSSTLGRISGRFKTGPSEQRFEHALKIKLSPVVDARAPDPLSADERALLFRNCPSTWRAWQLFKVNTSECEVKVPELACGLPPSALLHTRGDALLPLYEKLPLAAKDDSELYELLALFDGLRAGQAREREMARHMLEERLK